MSLSILFDKGLKTQIVRILVKGQTRTARQLFYELKKEGINATARGVYKALKELLTQKIIVKHKTDYEINPERIAQLGIDSNKALKKLLEKNLIGKHARDLKHICSCGKNNTEGFCALCLDTTCSHCGFKELKHTNCEINCLNCKCGHQEGLCAECGKPICLRCGKEVWVHEHQFCKSKNAKMNIAILEVDHDCWFSNTSEKREEDLMLNNFSDKDDEILETHSGIVKVRGENKHKIIDQMLKLGLKQAKLIHKTGYVHYIKTRATRNKSVDQVTKANSSILLNPIIAVDSKEQNLILSPSSKEMKLLSKRLQEFGGKARLVCMEKININKLDKIQNKKIKEFLKKIPNKKEFLDAVQRVRLG